MGNKSAKPCSQKQNEKSGEKLFREVGGRQFHNRDEASAVYSLPCDLEEQDRLNLEHYMLRYAWQSNFSAPVDKLLRMSGIEGQPLVKVLDVGCGTGVWLLEMASEYPGAKFYGVDIVPIFPQEIKPFNVVLQLANVIERIPFPDETFDYVFMRFMCLAFSEKQWCEKVIKEVLRVTKVGGYVEFFDFNADFTVEGPNTAKIMCAYREFLERRGVNPYIVPEIPRMLAETGQLELPIKVERMDIPVGNWAGKVGELMRQDVIQGFQTLKPFLPEFMNVSAEEFEGLLQELPDEFETLESSLPSGRVHTRKITSTKTHNID